ncbi:MAG: helix-hairpin-helix domain-containing protein, partial [Plesiomonas sp.]
VNAVGVDLNTASVALLTRVAGLSKTLAQNVVAFRDEHGRFESRQQLLKVGRLGPKAFEQCAGFLRINEGKNPLDASTVHPEAYPVVERILAATGKTVRDLMGNGELLRSVKASEFTDDRFGLPTVTDILKELEKPGRDPRPEFKTATFAEGVETLDDLSVGLILEGTVTNVTNFGAFVDIGVHQDGLVHISSLSDKFIDDPHKVVKAGDIVKVKVLEVDTARKRIALSMRLDEQLAVTQSSTGAKSSSNAARTAVDCGNRTGSRNKNGNRSGNQSGSHSQGNSAMSDALAAALRKSK